MQFSHLLRTFLDKFLEVGNISNLYKQIVWLHSPMLQQDPTILNQFQALVVHPFQIYQPNHLVYFEPFSRIEEGLAKI